MNTGIVKLIAKATPEEKLAAHEVSSFIGSAKAICRGVKSGVCSQEDFPLLWMALIDRLSGVSSVELKRLIEDFGFHVDGGEEVGGDVVPYKAWMKADCRKGEAK
jgi:hypothetical protein